MQLYFNALTAVIIVLALDIIGIFYPFFVFSEVYTAGFWTAAQFCSYVLVNHHIGFEMKQPKNLIEMQGITSQHPPALKLF